MTHSIDVLTIAYAIEEAGVTDVEIDRAYTGKGTMVLTNQTCAGIVVEDFQDMFKIMAALGATAYEDAKVLASQLRRDSMGYRTIYYFPGVVFNGALTKYDEEEL
jgi:hypothetical protein